MKREAEGLKVVKSHEYRRLSEENTNRSLKAYEFKMQNISAVLALNDLPFITGLTPAHAFQHLLEDMTLDRLENNPDERAMVLQYGERLVRQWNSKDTTSEQEEEEAPPKMEPPIPQHDFKARKVDYAAREHACRRLGKYGEEWVAARERAQLIKGGRPDLAKAVEHVSQTQGDGLGYDILSYALNESPKHIEVKTTNFDKTTRFLISENEVAFSALHASSYHLHRVFQFGSGPRLFTLQGAIERNCWLVAKHFQAGVI